MGYVTPLETTAQRESGVHLRPYQVEAMAAWQKRTGEGLRRGILNLPTGTGKTVLGLSIARKTGGRVLWLAHRDELIEQPQRTASVVWPDAVTGVVKADRDDVDAQVVFGSVQTVARTERLRRLIAAGGFDLVVVDEAHHAAAPSYMRVLDGVGAFAADGPPVLGLTATVERGDKIRLDTVFEEVIYQLPLLEAIKSGYLVDLVMRRVVLDIDLDEIPSRGGDWADEELGEALLQAGVADETAKAYIDHAAGRKALIFTVTVDQAKLTAEALRKRGVAAEWLSGATPIHERRAILERLHTGETPVVCNCAVLTEGFDEPSVSAVVVARPTRSKTLYLQMIGRGTRTYPGKDDCVIVDIGGASERHTLIQAPVLFGLDPEEAEGKTVTEAVAAADAKVRLVRGLVAASREVNARAAFHWVEADAGLFAMSLGRDRATGQDRGTLLLVARPGGWLVGIAYRGQRARPLPGAPGRPVDLTLAQGLAEDFARRLEADVLIRKDAAWRRRPASEGSLKALAAWGIEPRPGMTQGEASDLLTAAVARAAVRGWRR